MTIYLEYSCNRMNTLEMNEGWHLINILTNNGNIRNEKKSKIKLKRYTFKFTQISAAYCYRVQNLILNQCYDIVFIPYGLI